MPSLKGTVLYPTPESSEISVVQQQATNGDEIRTESAHNVKPRNLCKVAKPPIRYSNAVKH